MKGVTVTTTDHDTGDTETRALDPDDFVLVLGERMEIAHMQVYGNGTKQFTIKRREQEATNE